MSFVIYYPTTDTARQHLHPKKETSLKKPHHTMMLPKISLFFLAINAASATRVVVSITLPTTGANALMHDYDDVTEVTTNIIIENTDLTSLACWFPSLVLVTGNVQITNNGQLRTMDASFQQLETVTGYLDIFGNDVLVELGTTLPFPGGAGLVTGYVSIYKNPKLVSLGSALRGLVTVTGYCSVYGNAALGNLGTAFTDLETVTGYLSIHNNGALTALGETAFGNLDTVTGYVSIYANPVLASLGTAFGNLGTVTGYFSVANNPALRCTTAVAGAHGRFVTQTVPCRLTAPPTGPPAQ